ncbi:MAG: ParB N-terminal domain-containing protein, partial [Candidatus Paceibacterota bacterium]
SMGDRNMGGENMRDTNRISDTGTNMTDTTTNAPTHAPTDTMATTAANNGPAGVRLADIVRVAPSELRPHPLNARVFAEEPEGLTELREDIRERGILVPLIAKPDGTLLAGHNRLRVALELALDHVPVQRVAADITAEQEREFLVKDNVLRRQLSAEDKIRLVRELYMEEIVNLSKGGDRKSAEIKDQVIFDLPLPVRIEQETGIAAGTARRIITGIRRELGLVAERKSSSSDLRSSLSLSSQSEITQSGSSSSETKTRTGRVSAGHEKPASAGPKTAARPRKKLDPVEKVLRHLNSVRRTAADAQTARAALEELEVVRKELRKLARGECDAQISTRN